MTQQEKQDIVNYFNSIRNSGRIWIEVEMRHKDKSRFDIKYQTLTGQSTPVNFSTYPYYVWSPNADPNDKWGIELRIYFVSDNTMPVYLSIIAKNNNRNGYEQYDKRINNNEIIWELFSNGFVLGSNEDE
ncbi:MAG: hypothetical protein LBP63_08890 [Prevotellaceae bacterium]|jgi:hypothetical protein|nr:hypothetical protein [Prevotellaceae bacterium]